MGCEQMGSSKTDVRHHFSEDGCQNRYLLGIKNKGISSSIQINSQHQLEGWNDTTSRHDSISV